jgi:hypothetical protein
MADENTDIQWDDADTTAQETDPESTDTEMPTDPGADEEAAPDWLAPTAAPDGGAGGNPPPQQPFEGVKRLETTPRPG